MQPGQLLHEIGRRSLVKQAAYNHDTPSTKLRMHGTARAPASSWQRAVAHSRQVSTCLYMPDGVVQVRAWYTSIHGRLFDDISLVQNHLHHCSDLQASSVVAMRVVAILLLL
jgi:hypothetical protein